VRGEPNESLAHASVTLWGFVAGTAIARLAGLPPAAREQLAATGAATLLGTAYLAAGAIKLVNSGLAWIEPIRIQMLAVQFLDLPHPTWLTPLRTLLATSPNLAGTIAVATVALELAGGLYVVGPRIRAVLGTGLFAMHAGIWAVTGILFPSVMALLLALSYPWHRLARRAAPPSPDTPEPTPARRAWLGPAACALTAAVALALPSKTFNQPPTHPYYVAFLQQLHRVDRPAYDRLASGEGRLVDTLGPLRTAQPLADGWSIARLRTLPSAASITLARGDDRAELQLVPIPPEGAPPHARTFGPLLLRYQPGPVPSDAFQAAMDALWAELSAAAQGDPAARVLEWLP
jgi:hypothetical protein